MNFDLVIFHHTFLVYKARKEGFEHYLEKARSLKNLKAVKAILPQDEFMHMDSICEFINEFEIDCVFSVAPQTEWKKLYRGVDFDKVRFYRVLTGYVDTATVKRISMLARHIQDRSIDIGYRVGSINMLWGRHNFLKRERADSVLNISGAFGLVTDIMVGTKYGYSGDDWYRFLLKCKYTLGVEGGVSLLDYDGSIEKRVQEYLHEHKDAPFEELEAKCFPGEDGNIRLFALSPRHLEACITRTCQIMLEGEYNGILKPGQHFIEIKRDFSNLEEVIATVKADSFRSTIVERAYKEIIESGEYSYANFAKFVLHSAFEGRVNQEGQARKSAIGQFIFYQFMLIADLITVPGIWLLRKVMPKWVWRIRRRAMLGIS
jgi:hypothetical protein